MNRAGGMVLLSLIGLAFNTAPWGLLLLLALVPLFWVRRQTPATKTDPPNADLPATGRWRGWPPGASNCPSRSGHRRREPCKESEQHPDHRWCRGPAAMITSGDMP
jgi:hypothetical protein